MPQFASDNCAGMCPEALRALVTANAGDAPGYGEDEWTRRACDRLREVFETDCEVYFVFNGTAANSLALSSLCQSYHSVICHTLAHVETDECNAPEFFSCGAKLVTVGGDLGKLDPAAVRDAIELRADIHAPKPRVVTLTQATEVGTVYRPAEVAALAEIAHTRRLKLHMDGARFANAVAALGVAPAEITWRAGVDVLCFGGTKMGTPVGEAVIFFDRQLGEDFAWRCKQAGQLASKMRFLSAPWLGLLEADAWLRHAAHANAMAQKLAAGLGRIPGARVLYPVEANGVFVALPEGMKQVLRARGWRFYDFAAAGGVRLMCAWDTTAESIEALLADLVSLPSDPS